MTGQQHAIDDLGLGEGLRALHQDRARLPDPPTLHQRLQALPSEQMPDRRNRRWAIPRATLRPMLGATKFITAALVVAIFGSALLAFLAVGPRPTDDRPAVGATASASPVLGPDEPEATVLGPDELIDGFVTELIKPGVYRILRDAAGTDLRDVSGVAVSPDGDIWLATQNGIVQAGDPTLHLQNAEVDGMRLIAGSGGRLLIPGDPSRLFDGATWTTLGSTEPEPEWLRVLDLGGSAWGESAQEQGGHGVARVGPEGITHFPDTEIGIASGERCRAAQPSHHRADSVCGGHEPSFAGAPDGSMWVSYPGYGGGLARFDGTGWETFRPDGAASQFGVRGMGVGPDGVLWAGIEERHIDFDERGRAKLRDVKKKHFLARRKGDTWTLFEWPRLADQGRAGGQPHPAPDGTVWFGSVPGEPVSFDGTTWVTYRTPRLPGWRNRPDIRDLAVTTDGSVLVATELGYHEDRKGVRRALFLLRPEEMAPKRTEPAIVR